MTTDRGCYWLSRLRGKTSYEVIHVFYQRGDVFDGLVWLGAHRADRAKHAVRLVTFKQGKTLRRYITNVLEPRTFPMASMAEVYARRWDIEMAMALVKQHLKLRPVVCQKGGDSATDMGYVDNLAGTAVDEA